MALIETIARTISGREFSFRFYVRVAERDTQLRLAVDGGLARIPRAHLELMDPNILIVNRLPGGRASGGGFYPNSDGGDWRGREARTGVPDAELQNYLRDGAGIIAITKRAFERNIVHLSVTHEAAHSLDSRIHIYPSGATLADFAGIRYARPSVGEYAAEAYSRYCAARGAICRGGENCPHPDRHPRPCDEGISATLLASPAFQMLPAGELRRGASRSSARRASGSASSVRQAHHGRTSWLAVHTLDPSGSADLRPPGPCGVCRDDRGARRSWHAGVAADSAGASGCECD